MNTEALIMGLTYIILGTFILMALGGVITGSTVPLFDLAGLAAGVVSVVWLLFNI